MVKKVLAEDLCVVQWHARRCMLYHFDVLYLGVQPILLNKNTIWVQDITSGSVHCNEAYSVVYSSQSRQKQRQLIVVTMINV